MKSKKLTLLIISLFAGLCIAYAQNKRVSGTVVDASGEPVVSAQVTAKGASVGTVTDLDGNYSFDVPVSVEKLTVSYIGHQSKEVAAEANVSTVLKSQSLTVSGTVKDAATGKPLAGVNINVAEFSSAISEDNGNYSIKVPNGNAILEIAGFGYARREISVRGRNLIDLDLHETGYKGSVRDVVTPLGESSSLSIPYAWNTVAEDNNLSVATTPDILLQGYAAGINVVPRSGMPGNGSSMYLRGFNTMNAGVMPLFIIDGMPYENTSYASSLIGNYYANPLASIDPKDIESITVLKDGLALYGVKGANGVVLVKTLKAKGLETKINAHAHFGVNFEPWQLPVLNAVEHKNLLWEMIRTAYPDASTSAIGQLPFFDNRIPVQQTWGYEGNVDYYRYNHNTNWQNEIYNSASINQDYYLNVSGGDDVAIYMLSLGYLDQSGTLKDTHFQRFNTRFNSEIKLSQTVKVLANMSFVYGNKQLTNEGANRYVNPIFASLIKAPFTTSHVYNAEGKISPNIEPTDIFGNSNPYALANSISMLNINYRFFGSFELAWKINQHFDLSGLVGLNFNKEREKTFYPSVGVAFENLSTSIVSNESQHRVDRLFSLYGDLHADYKTRLGADHRLTARLGARYQTNASENDWGKGYNSSSDDFKSIQYGVAILRQTGGNIGNWNWMSIYGNVDYALKDKYFLNISASADASSRYGSETSAFLPFYSASLCWLLSGEEWFKDLSGIDLLKLRTGYGTSGNDDIGNYNGIQYYRPQNLLGAYGLIRGNLVNTHLKPETTSRLNAGLDISVLKERINLSFDVYSNTVSDMILFVTPSRLTGFDRYITNAGSMRNTGFEIGLNARIVDRTFKWDFGLMLSRYKNEALDLGGREYLTDVLGATIQTKEGQAIGKFYGYQTNGVYATNDEAAQDGLNILQGLVKKPFQAGDVRFVNQNGDDLIDEKDRVVIGDPNPDIFGSISNIFKFKQFTLNTLMTYSLGNDVYNYTRAQTESLSSFDNQAKSTLNRWRYEGDQTAIPRAVYGDPMGNSRFCDRWIEDGSYLKMKNITLSYDLNLKWKLIQDCVLFFTGENLFTLTKYKGLDTEFSLGENPLYYGIDACFVPQPRTLSLGLKLAL
ncbi:MAG: SusC/RagA family TonB-linked outer membrane protein [Bacteroidales bacterium]|jgi:TonB-linked SusC/RagA family outer membrane protein|nr:SusC/RagA family TonB-linked outer membrane protein [Bacteroidales bacterium]